jgi:hypothetical protein
MHRCVPVIALWLVVALAVTVDGAKILLFFVNSAEESLPRANAATSLKEYLDKQGGYETIVSNTAATFNRGSCTFVRCRLSHSSQD